jgi:hypothetical protein
MILEAALEPIDNQYNTYFSKDSSLDKSPKVIEHEQHSTVAVAFATVPIYVVVVALTKNTT